MKTYINSLSLSVIADNVTSVIILELFLSELKIKFITKEQLGENINKAGTFKVVESEKSYEQPIVSDTLICSNMPNKVLAQELADFCNELKYSGEDSINLVYRCVPFDYVLKESSF